MQLATSSGDQPWICTVWFVVDDNLNLYWTSWTSRRHSQEIVSNQKVAAAIVVQDAQNTKGIGIQVEGDATQLESYEIIKPIAEKYAAKFGFSSDWVEKFSSQQTKHKLYKLSPRRFVLFDEEHFPPNIGQEFLP